MRQIAVMAALAVGVSVMSVAAQGRNFSGTWVVDAEKTAAAAPAGGGGGAVATRSIAGGGVGGGVRSAGGGGAIVRSTASGSTDTVITLDASTFTVEVGGVTTSYPTNGTETPVEVRGQAGRASAKWTGDVLTITTTIEGPNGPVTSSQSWSLEGESLVRETARKTYYKRK
jgi:hypothetical protein